MPLRLLPLAFACLATLAANCNQEQKPPAPSLSAVEPTKGDLLGGTLVTLRGSNLKDASEVKFGGIPGTALQVADDGSSATVTSPAQAMVGPVPVSINTPGGEASLPNAFRYVNEVKITALEPARISANAEATITIRGSGFVPPVSVRVGEGMNALPPIIAGAGTVNAVPVTIPALPVGMYPVTVTNGENEAGSSPVMLEVAEGARIEEVDPSGGFSDESTPIRITGSGFNGVTAVLINNAQCTDLQLSNTVITCTVPPGPAGAAEIIVRRTLGDETRLPGGFTYYSSTDPTPRILFATPNTGRVTGGQTVEIAATGLAVGTPQITIGGNAATVQEVVNGKRVRVTTPSFTIAGTAVSQRVPISLTVGGMSDTRQNAFTYFIRPAFASITPPKGATAGGDQVTIFGEGFTETGMRVSFNGVFADEVVRQTGTSLTCKIPPQPAGTADIVIHSSFDQSEVNNDVFEYVEAVRITQLDPPTVSIAGGTIVMATGTGFVTGMGRMRVRLGGTELSTFTVLSSSQMKLVLPRRDNTGSVQLEVEDTQTADPTIARGTINVEYVDRTVAVGGAGGGPIQRNISVSVINRYTGERISGAEVFLGNAWADANSRHLATDDRGMAVIAADDLTGPVTITAARAGYENQTRVSVDASEITFGLTPYTFEEPPAPQLGQLSGALINWAGAGLPNGGAAGQFKRLAVVYVSEPDQGIGPPYPGAFNIISEEPCDITADGVNNPLPQTFTVDAPVGRTVALLAVVFFYDSKNGVCDPGSQMMPNMEGEGINPTTAGAMGLLTDLVVGPGTTPNINIPINRTVSVAMRADLVGAPSLGAAGNTARTVDAILDLGQSGIFTFWNVIDAGATITFGGAQPSHGYYFYNAADFMNIIPTGVPAPGGDIKYILRGISGAPALNEAQQVVGINQPLSEVFKRDVTSAVESLSGWFQFLQTTPADNGTVMNRRFTWQSPGQTASFYTIDIGEVLDPQTIEPRWTVILPGTATEFVIPSLAGAPNVTDLSQDNNLWQLGAYKIFDSDVFEYNDHTNDELGEAHWQARVLSPPLQFQLP